MLRPLALCLCLATPAHADLDAAVTNVVLPGFDHFAEAAGALARTAAEDCRAGTVRPAYQRAFDAWMAVGDLHLGPSETAALGVAFWPDDRGFTPRALRDLIGAEAPVIADPRAFAEVSIAARGLFALDQLLYDPGFSDYGPDSFTCALVTAVATDLDRQATALSTAWHDDFAPVLLTAGAPGNATYLAPDEAVRALYTQILSSLGFTADTRIGRPMGTFDRPRPRRAEAWRSGRPLGNVLLSVAAAEALAQALADHPLPATEAAAARVRAAAARIADPAFQDITDPQARLKLDVLAQAVRALRAAIETEVGTTLGITPGFNSQDGD